MAEPQPDVVVVGAGPAGLAAAGAAARAGARTLLLERGNEIGIPVRTSGASWIEDLQRLGVPPGFYHPTTRVRLVGPGHEVVFDYDPPINCVLDVRGLYQHLAVEAADRGAAIRLRSRAEGLAGGGLRYLREGRSVELHPGCIVDASGAAAAVARPRGLAGPVGRFGVGAEVELRAPGWDENELWLVVGSGVAPGGYGWVFPTPGGRVRAGVGILSPGTSEDPAALLRRFVRSQPRLAAGAEIEFHRGVIPSDGPRRATVADRLIAVGDSAGQVLATAGEGIRFALELGALAGTAAAGAALDSGGPAKALARYERQWSARYLGLFEISDRLNRRLAVLDDVGWLRALDWMERIGPAMAARLMRGDFFRGRLRSRIVGALLPVLARYQR